MKSPRLLFLLVSIFLPLLAKADYWISVASFKNRDSAETALVNAQSLSAQQFGVLGSATDKGYFFRVVAGPYSSSSAAKDAQAELALAGVNQGWILTTGAGDETKWNGSSLDGAGLGNGASSLPSADSLDDWDAGLDFIDDLDLDPNDPLVPAGQTPAQEPLPEIQETAPTGYKLNKLRRDARAPPLLPLNLVFTLSQTRPKISPSSSTTPDQNSNENVSKAHFEDGGLSLSQGAVGEMEQINPNTVVFSLDQPVALARRDEAVLDVAVDGRLDESVWLELPGADGFLVSDPDTLAQPPYATLVKAFYTDKGLYVGVDMEQPVDTLVSRLSSRDSRGVNRDYIGITLDTSGEGRYGYWMNVALGGSQSDGTVLPERQFSNDWDGAWYSGTAVTDSGWSAEFFLPWSQVAMPRRNAERIIKIYIGRKVAFLDERWTLPALPRTQPLFMSAMQPLSLQNVAPVSQWSAFPFVSSTADMLESEQINNFGADIFWRPSTNFQATAALQPDFGSVESDDVVVNLGAFETFFPEKRLFFQEGIEVFTATPRAEDKRPVTLLNTRRIGGVGREPVLPDDVTLTDPERQKPVELAGALKTVGSIGALRYGLLGAVEKEAIYEAQGQRFVQSGTDYGVGRVLYEDKTAAGDYRAIGWLGALTAHAEQDTQAHGVDYHYLTAAGKWKIDGQFLFSSADERTDGFGGFADIRRNFGQGRRLHLGYSFYDEHLDINDLGYLQRNDLRGGNGRYEVTRSESRRFRKTSVAYWFRLERNAAGEYVRKGLGVDAELDLKNRDQLSLEARFFPARDEDLDSRGNGTYRLVNRKRLGLDYRTDRAKAVSYEASIRQEDEKLGGSSLSSSLGVNWRPRGNLSFAASLRYVDRSGWLLWREGINFATFEADEWRPEVRLEFFPTAKHQLKLSAQWVGIKAAQIQNYQLQTNGAPLTAVDASVQRSDDFAISNLSLQLRYRWELAPLSDLFVVYTLNGRREAQREAFDDLLSSTFEDPMAEQLTLKLRYRFGS